ncbi:flagellar basal body protein, partial [Acinetobacter baumannii]
MADHPLTIFDVAGRAMSAQLVRLNTTASYLANVGVSASSADAAYRSIKPVFRT